MSAPRRLGGLPISGNDAVVFDGSAFGGIAATGPARILQGGWNDWKELENALSAGSGGGLAGWFDYDGNFRFGDFPEWEPCSAIAGFPSDAKLRAPQSFRAGLTKH
jgi:hypothetical protein